MTKKPSQKLLIITYLPLPITHYPAPIRTISQPSLSGDSPLTNGYHQASAPVFAALPADIS